MRPRQWERGLRSSVISRRDQGCPWQLKLGKGARCGKSCQAGQVGE